MSTAVFERSFLRSVASLGSEDQKKCLQAIYWFEHKASPGDRQRASVEIEFSIRRRLRVANASRSLRVVYATMNRNDRRWVWAGEDEDLEQTATRLDDAEDDAEPETLDVKTVLAWLKDSVLETAAPKAGNGGENGHTIEDAAPITAEPPSFLASGTEVDRLVEAADAVSLFVAESRSVWERVKSRLGQTAVAEPEARGIEVVEARVVQPTQAEAKVEPPSADVRADPVFQGLARDYNAMRAENERLKKALDIERKRTNLEKLEATRALGRMSSEETRIAQDQVRRLTIELSVLRATDRRTVLAEEARQTVKDACSKVVDEYAGKLAATEIPSLEEQAREIYKLAVRIRALKA